MRFCIHDDDVDGVEDDMDVDDDKVEIDLFSFVFFFFVADVVLYRGGVLVSDIFCLSHIHLLLHVITHTPTRLAWN